MVRQTFTTMAEQRVRYIGEKGETMKVTINGNIVTNAQSVVIEKEDRSFAEKETVPCPTCGAIGIRIGNMGLASCENPHCHVITFWVMR